MTRNSCILAVAIAVCCPGLLFAQFVHGNLVVLGQTVQRSINDPGDVKVVAFAPRAQAQRLLYTEGSSLARDLLFSRTGTLYVALNARIVAMSATGLIQRSSAFVSPWFLAIGANGPLYFSSQSADPVTAMSEDLVVTRTLPTAANQGFEGIDLAADQCTLY